MTTGFVTDRDGTWIEKGPGETLDYCANMADHFKANGDPTGVITNATVQAQTGITVSGVAFLNQKVTFLLAGGTVGTRYTVTVFWTSAKTPLASRSFTVRVVNR